MTIKNITRLLLILCFLIIIIATWLNAQAIDWNNLENPVYQHEDWSTKDACMIYKDGMYYIFFSAFYHDRGRERSHVVGIKTSDFETFSEPLFIWDGQEDGWIGMASPNITKIDNTYYLTYNSWGNKLFKPNQLFYATSTDLETWENNKPLATNLTKRKSYSEQLMSTN